MQSTVKAVGAVGASEGAAAQGSEDEAFDEEIREHIALLEERYAAQGMSAEEAARTARRQFVANASGRTILQRAAPPTIGESGLSLTNALWRGLLQLR